MPISLRPALRVLPSLAILLAAACSDEPDNVTRSQEPSPTALETTTDDTPIYTIQGRSHVSPQSGARLSTSGVVTALRHNGFFLQDPSGDGDLATADGIFVFTSSRPTVLAGQMLRVTGTISEFIPGGASTGNLSTTQLGRTSSTQPLVIELLSSGNALPAPVVIGQGGRIPPAVYVISPSETTSEINLQLPATAASNPFTPETDGLDFYESLEGMRVTLQDPVAVSAVHGFSAVSSEAFTLVDQGAGAEPATALTERGGILLGADPDNRGDQQPERAQVQFDGTVYPGSVPAIGVGDRLGNVTGVMSYDFGNFEVLATEVVQVFPSGLERERTAFTATATA